MAISRTQSIVQPMIRQLQKGPTALSSARQTIDSRATMWRIFSMNRDFWAGREAETWQRFGVSLSITGRAT